MKEINLKIDVKCRLLCWICHKQTKMFHYRFDDPSFVIDPDEQITAEFRRVRDEIRDYIAAMPENLK